MTSKSMLIAQKIKEKADRLGWKIQVRGSVVTITRQFRGKDGFVECDMQYYDVLSEIPQTQPGSIWGTDGGGVGALAAMSSGLFKMHKSGCSTLVVKALAKLGC